MDGTILVDPAADGSWNMIRDQFLAEYSSEKSIAILRIYGWDKPTLSLGRFQKEEEREQSATLSEIDWVRRGTGGGAILHDHDWTYSIAWPNGASQSGVSSREKGHEQRLYHEVHQGIVRWLRGLGWNAQLHRDSVPLRDEGEFLKGESKAFLCFDRRSELDIVVDGAKVLGSAQKRIQGAVLQHGSLLLSASGHAPHLRGLLDLGGTELDSLPRLQSCDQEGFIRAIRTSLNQIGVSKWLPMSIDLKDSLEESFIAKCEGRLGPY